MSSIWANIGQRWPPSRWRVGKYRAVGSSRAGVRVRSAEGKDGAWANIGLVFGCGQLRAKMARGRIGQSGLLG